MGRLKKIIYICLAMVLCFTSAAPSVHAAEKIDVDREASLTVQYSNSDRVCESVQVKIYKIADVDAEGKYTLCDDFTGYGIDVNGVASQDEWKTAAGTLVAYAEADNVKADRNAKTDSSGTVIFSGLTPGLYLNVAAEAKLGTERIRFENFLTAVPYPDQNGSYKYNVIAYPKSESYIPEQGKVEYKVVKHWKDAGNSDKRPDEVRVEIIKNGVHESYQILNADNNWTYRWTAEDDGSKWQVVERDKPEEYKVRIDNRGRTVIITNTYAEKNISEENSGDAVQTGEVPHNGEVPQTGDTTSMWPYVGAMCFAGAVMLLFAIWRKREE